MCIMIVGFNPPLPDAVIPTRLIKVTVQDVAHGCVDAMADIASVTQYHVTKRQACWPSLAPTPTQ